MDITEAQTLISTGRITSNTGISVWADLGCGDGLFTIALSHLLRNGSTIYGIDKNSSLQPRITGNGVQIIPVETDFVEDELGLRNLDGILMANALHYVRDKSVFIRKIQRCLKPGAVLLVVEYDTDTPVAKWVPYPLGFLSLTRLFQSAGYGHIEKLGERPSVFGRSNMYAALVGE